MKRVTIYSRASCHLCDVALEAIERARAQQPFDLEVKDLDTEASPEKRAAYDWEVPVVEIDGKKAFKYQVDEARLLRLLGEE